MTNKKPVRYRPPHELAKNRVKRESVKSLDARWTPLLAHTKHTQIVNGFLDYYAKLRVDNLSLNSSDAMLIIHLMRFKWDQNAPYPAYSLLAGLLGVQVPAVRKILQKLERMGYVTRIPRREQTADGEDGQWLGNFFDLGGLFAALEVKLREAQPKLGTLSDEEGGL